MDSSKNNIKFCYRYRDYANYKKYNEVIFANPNNRTIEEVEKFIKQHLFDNKLFYATQWKLPDLHFEDFDPELDHFVHEFISVELTPSEQKLTHSIEEFIEIVEDAINGWLL